MSTTPAQLPSETNKNILLYKMQAHLIQANYGKSPLLAGTSHPHTTILPLAESIEIFWGTHRFIFYLLYQTVVVYSTSNFSNKRTLHVYSLYCQLTAEQITLIWIQEILLKMLNICNNNTSFLRYWRKCTITKSTNY